MPGASSTHAFGIEGNNIVDSYSNSPGISHGFIYSIPEPSTLLLFTFGGVTILRKRRS
jgi:hypothetical protein